MTGSLCTTISSKGQNPVESTITHETTVTASTGGSIEVVSVTYEFKILSEISPDVFRVSGDNQATDINLDQLKTCLSGVLLLVEYDGQFRRLWTWLWKYGLSRDIFGSIHLAGDYPVLSGLGRGYILRGSAREMYVGEKVLDRKWAGRLLIQQYYKRSLVFRYIWQDIHAALAH